MTTLNEKQLAVPSEDFQYYIDQYKIKHSQGYTSMYEISPTYTSRELLKEQFSNHKIETLLDYGVGKALHFTKAKLDEYWGVTSWTGYDPAVEEFSVKPEGEFDAVICYDVLEHIPEGSIDYALQEIFRYSKEVVFLHVGMSPAKALLPNGENAHTTIRPREWWIEKINTLKSPHHTVYFHKTRID